MTACVVSLFRPVKTSVQHDEVSSLSINPVIELRQGRRDSHTKVVRDFSASIPPSLHPLSMHIAWSSFVYLPHTHTHTFPTCTFPDIGYTGYCWGQKNNRNTDTYMYANSPSWVHPKATTHLTLFLYGSLLISLVLLFYFTWYSWNHSVSIERVTWA